MNVLLKAIGVSLIACLSFPVNAQQQESCMGLIGLSKVTNETVSDSSDVESNARQFCSDYSHHHGDSSSFSFGASYDFLAASLGTSSASVDDVASHYCDASNNWSAKSNAYRTYVESIAPGAYDAYKTCISSQDDITFTPQGSTTTEMVLSYEYRASHENAEWGSLTFVTSHDVTCRWDRSTTAVERSKTGSQGLLKCRRPTAKVKSFVTVARTDGAGSITIPWPAYDENGIPIDNLRQITTQLQSLTSAVTFNQLPIGTILPFYNKGPVPAGWVPCDANHTDKCPDLTGLFLRGVGKADDISGQPQGNDTATVPWNGSDGGSQRGDGWGLGGDHWIPKTPDQKIPTVPRYAAVLYIMKVANQ